MTLQSKWKMTWKLELCRVFAVSNNQGPALGVPILRIMIMRCLWKPRLPHTPSASFVTLSSLFIQASNTAGGTGPCMG